MRLPILITLLFFSLFVQVQAQAPRMLQGHVEHSATLAPIEDSLRAGAQFDVTKLQALTPNNMWYQIPSWMAGEWKSTHATNYFRQNLKNGSRTFKVNTFGSRSNESMGFQKDRTGSIWEYSYGSYIAVTDQDYSICIQKTRHHEVLESDNDHVVVLFRSTKIIVNKRTRRIQESYQTESIQTYTAYGRNMRKVDASSKIFDDNGQPELLVKILTFDQRIQPFAPCYVFKGQNMVKLFREYLFTHNLAHLIPEESNALPSATKTSIRKVITPQRKTN